MRVFTVTPPPPLVNLEEADAHLRLGGDTGQQAYVQACIEAASGHIDGPNGWLGRSIGIQTLEARRDTFCSEPFELPYGPVINIVSAKYIDGSGVEQTISTTGYELLGRSLQSAYSVAWPTARSQREAVRIRYRTGFVENPTADPLIAAVPAPIKAAVLLMVGDMFRFRESAAMGTWSEIPMSSTVANLLSTYRAF